MEQADVIIIGSGPTGVVLANLLGALGVKVIVLEQDAAIYPIPRATHVDEETLRNFQMTGLLPELASHYATFGFVEFTDKDGKILLEERVGQANSLHGYSGSCFFDQPAFETILRAGLARFPNVTLHLGTKARAITEHPDGVTVRASQAGASNLAFSATWIVGCDGGGSFLREAKEIVMDSLAPKRDWLIVDTLLKNPADAALLPDRFRYLLDPARLTIYAYGFGRNRRWEFQLGKNEAAPDTDTVRRWLTPYIDPGKLEIIRIAKYAHNSLVAQRWREGHCLLAGDAAHMMPPSAGQGMCSGIRDAVNLAWKLGLVIRGRAGEQLLDTYETERKPHVRNILRGTLFISNRLQADDECRRRWREFQLKAIGKLPPLRAVLRHFSLRRKPLKKGFLANKAGCVGHHFPQFTAQQHFSDDIFGYRFVLITKPRVLTLEIAMAARQRGLALFGETPASAWFHAEIDRWLNDTGVDFVILRPDKVIFGAGPIKHFPRVMADFDAGIA